MFVVVKVMARPIKLEKKKSQLGKGKCKIQDTVGINIHQKPCGTKNFKTNP